MGENKKRKTFSLDADVVGELSEQSGNASRVVNRLLTEYLKSGRSGPVGLEIKLRDIEGRIDDALNERDRINRRLERLRNEKDRVEREIEQLQRQEKDELAEAAQYVRGRSPDNPAVQNWADKLGMRPTELVTKVEKMNGVEA